MHRISTLLGIAFLSHVALAQRPDLSALNTAYSGVLTFKLDKSHRLVIDHFDEGQRFRQDLVALEDIDPEQATYSVEERAIALKCKAHKAQCFTKEIFKLDVVRKTSRLTIPVIEDDPEGQRGLALLGAMLRDTDVADHSAETNDRP